MDKEAIERELKFREVLEEIKRTHIRDLNNLLDSDFKHGEKGCFKPTTGISFLYSNS